MSAGDWMILGLLAAGVVAAVWHMRRHKGCGGGCGGCPHAGDCAKHKED